MGSGKTTVARLLHEKLQWPVNDTDSMIESKKNMTISEIFAKEGEEKFRDYETEILMELKDQDFVIVSTGGGIIEKERNHELLTSNSVVFYLKTTPQDVLKFTAKDQNRPLLQQENPLEFITKKLQSRERTYEKLAHLQMEASKISLEAVAEQIISSLKLK